jgi:hypothetical protein
MVNDGKGTNREKFISRNARIRGLTRTGLAEVTPVVEFVGVFLPAVADVRALVHVGDHDVFDAGADPGLGLLHGLANADAQTGADKQQEGSFATLWMTDFVWAQMRNLCALQKPIRGSGVRVTRLFGT